MIDIKRIRSNIDSFYRHKNTEKQVQHNSKYCAKYYDSKQWKDLRESYKLQHPLCEVHLKYGICVPGTSIHHKHPFMKCDTEQEKWKLLLDEKNLINCCESCHKEFHRQLREKNLDYLNMIVPVELKDNMEEDYLNR